MCLMCRIHRCILICSELKRRRQRRINSINLLTILIQLHSTHIHRHTIVSNLHVTCVCVVAFIPHLFVCFVSFRSFVLYSFLCINYCYCFRLHIFIQLLVVCCMPVNGIFFLHCRCCCRLRRRRRWFSCAQHTFLALQKSFSFKKKSIHVQSNWS